MDAGSTPAASTNTDPLLLQGVSVCAQTDNSCCGQIMQEALLAKPTCTIIAGPNGAGKTTFALQYLPEVAGHRRFVNADLIAAGLAPLEPATELAQASRLFLNEIETCIGHSKSFAFETTLAGRGHLRIVKRLRAQGWHVQLIYLALLEVTVSESRVAERVSYGGHDISANDIHRRFPRSLANLLNCYAPLCDQVSCYDNTSETPTLIFEQSVDARRIHDQQRFNRLFREINE